MLLNSLLLGGSIVMTSAAATLPSLQFYSASNWAGASVTITPQDGVCSVVPVRYSGSMKMLGDMECAIWSLSDCEVREYHPRGKYRHGPNDNTPKPLWGWIDESHLDAGGRLNGPWPAEAFICRNYQAHLNDPDSSSKNVHVPFDGWHEPKEVYGGLDLVPPPVPKGSTWDEQSQHGYAG